MRPLSTINTQWSVPIIASQALNTAINKILIMQTKQEMLINRWQIVRMWHRTRQHLAVWVSIKSRWSMRMEILMRIKRKTKMMARNSC